MIKAFFTGILTVAAMAIATPAHAVFIEFGFTGTVENEPTNGVRVGAFNPSGQTVYDGPEFDFPFGIGDTLTFTYSALFDINAIPPQNRPADNIYRIRPSRGPGEGPGTASVGLRSIDGQADGLGQYRSWPFAPFGFEIIYDANDSIADDERVALDFSSGPLSHVLSSPGYYYDASQNSISTGFSGRCDDTDREGCAGLTIDKSFATISGTPVLSQTDPLTPPFINGAFNDIRIKGRWSVPVITGDDPVDVPAPPAILLFGLGVGMVIGRHRQRD